MPVIYELHGRVAAVSRARTQPVFRVYRRLSVLPRRFGSAHDEDNWTASAQPRKNILSELETRRKKTGG